MRVNLGFLGFMMASSIGAIGFSACGSSVTEITGGTGGGATGTGGAQMTSGTTTVVSASSSSGNTTTTTTTSTSVSSSSGGGDVCMQACDHIKTCVGFDLCANGLNLDCSNPQYECTAQCINAISCADLNFQSGQACLQQCAPQDAGPIDAGDPCMNACAHVQQCFGFDVCSALGMQIDCSVPQNVCTADCVSATPCNQLSMQTFQTCQGSCQGTDGGSTDGGSLMSCQQCSAGKCQTQLGACNADATCKGWLMCVGGCAQAGLGASCYMGCDTNFSGASALYQQVYSCGCANCSAECSGLCSQLPDGGP